jgi:hypothetical protein
LTVYGENDVRWTEIYASEPLVPEIIAFEFEMAIEMRKRNKLPFDDKIPAEFIKHEIRKLINP